jgi:hypothetical protein
VVELTPGNPDHPPARCLEAPVAGSVLLEGGCRVVESSTVELDDEALVRPSAVDLVALDADVGFRVRKTGIEEEGLEALFELAADDRQAALCFLEDSLRIRMAGLRGYRSISAAMPTGSVSLSCSACLNAPRSSWRGRRLRPRGTVTSTRLPPRTAHKAAPAL